MQMRGMVTGWLVLLVGGVAAAQGARLGYTPRKDAAQVPSYELVSIHKTAPDTKNNPGIQDVPGGMQAGSQSLRSLISEAYGFSLGLLNEQEIEGGPAWAKTQLFDIQAKVDASNLETFKALGKTETMRVSVQELASRTPSFRSLMLQRVLEDRFKLKVHYEQRTMSLYEMTVAKGGVKMPIAHPKDPESGNMQMDSGKLKGENVPISFIAAVLKLEVKKPVQDETGVQGNYDFDLHWSQMDDVQAAEAGKDDSGPSFYTALQEQLGLKLKPGKGPVWVVVVDHAEMPDEN